DDEYLQRFYSSGGAFQLGHRLSWLAENFTPRGSARIAFATYAWHLPLETSDVATIGGPLPQWRAMLAHPSYDAYWKTYSIRERIRRVNIPVLSFGGWF